MSETERSAARPQRAEGALSHDAIAAEVEAELEHHVELLRDELRARGVRASEIEDQVQRRFGDRARIRSACLRQRTSFATMKQRLHWLLTASLVVGLVSLIVLQRRANAEAASERDQLLAFVQQQSLALFPSPGPATDTDGTPFARQGDLVRITDVFGSVEGTYFVDAGGCLVLPDIGRLPVAGMTPDEIQSILAEKATVYFVDSEPIVELHRADSTSFELLTTLLAEES